MESNEIMYYDKESVKLDCLDCEQVLHSREMGSELIGSEETYEKGSCVIEFCLIFHLTLKLL